MVDRGALPVPSKNIVPYKADMEPLYGTVRFRTVAPIDVLRTVLLLSTTDEREIVGITLRIMFVYISLFYLSRVRANMPTVSIAAGRRRC